MKKGNFTNEWQSADHVLAYFDHAKKMARLRVAGERLLLDQIPASAKRVLDLGTGDGRLLAMVKSERPAIEGVALDFSEPMLKLARKRFAKDNLVQVVKHDLNVKLPASKLGRFDAIVSCLAIHHLTHARKKRIYGEIFDLLSPRGVFLQSRARRFANPGPTPQVLERGRLDTRGRRSLEQIAGRRNSASLASGNRIPRGGLLLEMARICALGRLQT